MREFKHHSVILLGDDEEFLDLERWISHTPHVLETTRRGSKLRVHAQEHIYTTISSLINHDKLFFLPVHSTPKNPLLSQSLAVEQH